MTASPTSSSSFSLSATRRTLGSSSIAAFLPIEQTPSQRQRETRLCVPTTRNWYGAHNLAQVKLWSVKDNAATCETTLKLDAPATSLASTVLNEHMLLIVGLETGSLLLYGFASSSALSACALIQVIDNGCANPLLLQGVMLKSHSLAHTGAVNQLAFSPRPPSDTVRLASCADDGHVRLLELAA